MVLGPELIRMAFNSVSRSFPYWLTGRKTPTYLPIPSAVPQNIRMALNSLCGGPPPPPPIRRTYRYVPCPKPFDVLAGRPSVRIPQMFQATVSVFSVAAVCIGMSFCVVGMPDPRTYLLPSHPGLGPAIANLLIALPLVCDGVGKEASSPGN